MFFKDQLFFSLFMLMTSILSFDVVNASTLPTVMYEPVPEWVEKIKFSDKNLKYKSEASEGEYYLLADDQVNVLDGRVFYSHYAIKLFNENAVEKNSRITIDFSPDYQSMQIHEVILWRNGVAIKQKIKNKLKLLQREKELENLIYDGRWTATLLLDDVRKGDVLEYSYSLKGQNPAFRNNHSELVYLQWSVPVARRYFRLLWPDNLSMAMTSSSDKIKEEIKVTPHAGYKEYSIERDQYPTHQVASETPGWFDPWDRISFSSTTNWSEVVNWAIEFYDVDSSAGGLHDSLVKQIKNKYSTRLAQASAALHYVQDEVRYVGIEVGAGGYIPSKVNETLARRYGDCKDKTFLLLSILKELDIEAYPVLANTEFGEGLHEDGPRLNAFNHVLVKAKIDGKNYWLETTTNNQSSTIDKIFQPDYGQVLELRAGNDGLTQMHQDQPYHVSIYDDVFDLSNGVDVPASYTVQTMLIGEGAEKFRRNINKKGRKKVVKEYLNYYMNYYKTISSADDVVISDDKVKNQISVVEKYTIPGFWSKNEEKQRNNAYFYGNAITSYISKPKEVKRNSPFKFSHPVNVKQRLKILLPAKSWDLQNEEKEVSTPFFSFSYKSNYDDLGKILTLEYHYKSEKKYINADEISEYVAAVDKINKLLEYSIYLSYESSNTSSQQGGLDGNVVYLVIVIVLLSLLLYTYIEFRINQKNAPKNGDNKYYAVASSKVFLLSIFTYGSYLIYWFYKNWFYVKRRENFSIIPWGRALFYYLWFYPLYKSLAGESVCADKDASRPANYRYVLLAVAFFVATVVSNVEQVISYVALVLSASLILPLVEKINHLSLSSGEHYSFNSRWRPRHFIFIVIFSLIALLDVSSRIYLIPSDEVVDGAALWEKDIIYMQRIGVLSPADKLVLFYSDALFNMQKDGNGLSNVGVFSYWRDDTTGSLYKEEAKFNEIADVKYRANASGPNTIQITRKDGSDFVLYVNDSSKHSFYIEMERYREAYKNNKSATPID